MRQYEDMLIDALLDYGFTLAEAHALILLQERVQRQRRRRIDATKRQQGVSWPQTLDGLNSLN